MGALVRKHCCKTCAPICVPTKVIDSESGEMEAIAGQREGRMCCDCQDTEATLKAKLIEAGWSRLLMWSVHPHLQWLSSWWSHPGLPKPAPTHAKLKEATGWPETPVKKILDTTKLQ